MTSPRARKPPTLALLVWIAVSGTLPMHVFVPALPAVAAYFHATAGEAQLTITLYLAGLAIGQLLYGPLSDRYGRRPVLIAGLCLFAVATIAAAFAVSLAMLVAARIAQAMGGCAGLVLGRAIARDNAAGQDAVRSLAALLSVMTMVPAIAPVVGAQLAAHFGWRSILYVLAVSAVVVTGVTYVVLGETHHSRGSRSAREYALSYWRLARSRTFMLYAIGGAAGTTSIFAFVAASPFVLVEQFNLSLTAFSLVYVTIIGGATVGATLAGYLVRRVSEKLMFRAASTMLVGSAVLLVLAYLGGGVSVGVLTVLTMIYVLGAGLTSPNAMAAAINIEPEHAGAASALYGCAQMGYGALCTAAIGLGHDNPLQALIITLFVSSLVSMLALELARMGRARAALTPTDASR